MALNTAELPRKIDELTSLLRSRDERSISLVDVASVTGILISTMQAYFGSIDTTIYNEFSELSKYMERARRDIAALQPAESEHIPRAGQELEAIVESTEEATNTIMQASEEIMSADASDAESYQALVNDAIMRIFEACSFQDITGQRISKVIESFTYIEKRLHKVAQLVESMDGTAPSALDDIEDADELLAAERKRKLMLNGPQLKGEAKDQDQIDELFHGHGHTDSAPDDAGSVMMQGTTGRTGDKGRMKLAADAKPLAMSSPVTSAVAGDEKPSQSDIDALFT